MAVTATPKLAGDMLKHGQELYHQKKYQDALQCFNCILPLGDSYLYNALDNKAATHIKLGDLKAALGDGRRMIKLDKARSVGYLRTGRILQLLGESKSAMRIYKYGLSNVSSNDANIELLQNAYNKTVKLFKTSDPLKVLPLELVAMVMKYLTFPNIVDILRVSKLWSLLLSSISMIWSHLDFSRTSKQVSMTAIHQYVKRSEGGVNRASIHFFKKHHSTTLKYIISKCKSLNRIDILSGHPTTGLLEASSSASMLKTLIISRKCEISISFVCHLLEFCTNLDRAEFHYCNIDGFASWRGSYSKIRSLIINNGQSLAAGDRLCLPLLLEKIPKVQHLSLKHWNWLVGPGSLNFNFRGLKQLQSLDMSHSEGFRFPLLPISVETLDFSSCLYDPSCLFHANDLPALTGLSIADHYHISARSVLSLLKSSKGTLKTLNIKGCHNLFSIDYFTLIQEGYLNMVTHLGLGSYEVGDEIIESLATNLPHLKILDLDSTKVTGIGVKALALKESRILERLILKNCEHVSTDATEYARSRGISVHFSMPDARRR